MRAVVILGLLAVGGGLALAEDEPREAARAIRQLYPRACQANLGPEVPSMKCIGETKGYAATMACLEREAASARATASGLPRATWSSSCAREIDAAIRGYLEGKAAYVEAPSVIG
jgi:hypothetical protein